jgi:hypothetical protein
MAYQNTEVNNGIASIETGGNYNPPPNPESTASGKYQFILPTFEGVKRNNPTLPQISFEEFKKNPQAQEQYQSALLAENTATLEKNGLDVNPVNQYVMHWAGAPKGSALLKAKDTDVLGDFINEKVLAKNKLSPATTIGDFKANIDRKMNVALSAKTGSPVATPTPSQNIADVPYKAPEAPKPTPKQTEQMAEWDALHNKIQNMQVGSPDFNKTVADGITVGEKKQFGPNWTKAILSAIAGDKQRALTYITGGMEDKPQIAEAIVDGSTRQVWINKNERGDTWFTDPATGRRLPDTTKITSTTPEGAIGTGIQREQGKVAPLGMGGQPLTLAEQNALKVVGETTQTRAQELPTERNLISSVSTGTKNFAQALDNATRGPQAEAFIKALNSIKGGLIDEDKIKEAVTLANLPQDQRGPFAEYLRSIATLNQRDKQLLGKHGPGAGAHGVLDLSGGAKGVNQYLVNRSTSYGYQAAWNDFYDQNKNTGKSASAILKDFENSDTYRGLENYKKIAEAKVSGKTVKINDREPVVDFDRSGRLVMKTYNAKTGKAE